MGQHFMVDDHDLAFLADSLSLEKGEAVLEIGPGLGFLTKHLLGKEARVIAVEKDAGFAAFLRDSLGERPLRLIETDVLKVELEKELGAEGPVKVIGNIPYNITSPILEWLVSQRRSVREAVLTIQWEVAQRMTARPGTKAWGALSLFVQVYSEVTVLRKIERSHFFPPPNVDSAVVRFVFSAEPRGAIGNEQIFFSLVHRAFQKRRKTILNALKDEDSRDFTRDSLTETLKKAGIDPNRRPETLLIEEWARLAGLFSQTQGPRSC
jgi:16S rRNA (adenine1518-N6/adenine1519-N6)-dimethyltransferase